MCKLWSFTQSDILSATAKENRSGGGDDKMTAKTMMAVEPQT